MNKKQAVTTRLILLSTVLILLGTISFGLYHYRVESQTQTSCSTCSEEYHNCRMGIGDCVERRVQDCRTQGGDESQCENARPQFEAECAESCYQTFENCWLFCSPRSPNPPPQQFPSGECPQVQGNFRLNEVGTVEGNVYFTNGLGDSNVVFYIDGEIHFPDEGINQNLEFEWKIPIHWRDGEEHILEGYVQTRCVVRPWPPTTYSEPMSPSHIPFILY